MRERSHEIGRRQLLGAVKLLTRQTSNRVEVEVVEIGTAYKTGMPTRYAAHHQPQNAVVYDAVLGFRYRKAGPEVTCLIESKATRTNASASNLPGYLAEFVARAYCVQSAWSDDIREHRPLFLFAAGSAFSSDLVRRGKLHEGAVMKDLPNRLQPGMPIDPQTVKRVCAHTRILIYDDWLDELIG